MIFAAVGYCSLLAAGHVMGFLCCFCVHQHLCGKPHIFGEAALVSGLKGSMAGISLQFLTSAPSCCQPLCSKSLAYHSLTPGSSLSEPAKG